MEFESADISYRHYIYLYSFLGIWIERKMSSVDQVLAVRKRRMRRMKYAKDTGKLKISSNLNLLRFPVSTESDQKGNCSEYGTASGNTKAQNGYEIAFDNAKYCHIRSIINHKDVALTEHITECKGEYLKNKLTM